MRHARLEESSFKRVLKVLPDEELLKIASYYDYLEIQPLFETITFNK